MSKLRYLILSITILIFGLIVFWPHFFYPYPFHVDEWHHITEAKRLLDPTAYFNWLQAEPGRATSGLEIGFQFLLLVIGKIFNLILIYKFLPAIWAILSGLSIFFVTYQKSSRNFLIAWLSLLFFMTIRTNANLTGLWFFTPLSFSFPFIFLYTYFLSEGLIIKNTKYLLLGLGIMLALLAFHPLSVLFSLPIFAIFAILNYKELRKIDRRLWLLPFVFIIGGIAFFSLIFGINPLEAMGQIFAMLKFSHGWGVLELNNSLFELYSLPAWIWAVIGFAYLLYQKPRHYSFYLLWPTILLVSTLIYRLFDISYFSPFQRNLYYLVLALPILSAYGLGHFVQTTLPHWLRSWPNKKNSTLIISVVLVIVTIFSSFLGYYTLPKQSRIYRVMSQDDYQNIQFLNQESATIVMSTPFIGTALIAQTRHQPVGTIAFYSLDRKKAERFYLKSDCEEKQKIIESTKTTIVYWPKILKPLNCPGLKIRRESKESFLYSVIKK